jgi:hypothetical protein
VQNLSVVLVQDVEQRAEFATRDLPWLVAKLPEPKAPYEMRCWFANNVDRLKRKALRLFAFLRDDYWRALFQCGDLPVDVEHLRFQKRRAVTGDYGA